MIDPFSHRCIVLREYGGSRQGAHYWKVGEEDLDQAIREPSTTHSKASITIDHKLALLELSKGLDLSHGDSEALDQETKKPKESLGLVSIYHLWADAGLPIKIGEEGLEPPTSTL